MSSKIITVFSENRDYTSMYKALAGEGEFIVQIKGKNKSELLSLFEGDQILFIYEVMHPVMTEIEGIDRIHSIKKNVPIIVVSSYFYDTKDIVFGKKIADFLIKPCGYEQLSDSVKNILKLEEEPQIKPEVVVQEEKVIEPSKEEDHYEASVESKKLSILIEISKRLNAKESFDELFNDIITLSAEAMNAERATLFLLDKKTNELWSRTGIGLKQKEIRFSADSGIAGDAVSQGKSEIIDDPYSHPKFNKEIDKKTGFTTRNILCMPIRNLKGEIIGVFQLLNKKDGNFTKDDQVFLGALAGSTGITLENSLLQEELKKQLQEIKNAYEEIYISQNQILKDTRISTISQISGFLNMCIKDCNIETNLKKLAERNPFDPILKKETGKLIDKFNEFIKKLQDFLAEIQKVN